ncbi:hypothetical protein CASFOL_039490 [Castilleja foliolosa]|uniref:Uncharacterized protein n=1 Tax=Castilleja foliolosa TaxID=1961234 RepID=A0ABD3BJ84_9LAMI
MSEIINKEPAGPLFSGEDIGHLLSKANFIPPEPCNPLKKNKLKKVAMHDDEDPRGLDELFPDIPHDCVLTQPVGIVGLAGFVMVVTARTRRTQDIVRFGPQPVRFCSWHWLQPAQKAS